MHILPVHNWQVSPCQTSLARCFIPPLYQPHNQQQEVLVVFVRQWCARCQVICWLWHITVVSFADCHKNMYDFLSRWTLRELNSLGMVGLVATALKKKKDITNRGGWKYYFFNALQFFSPPIQKISESIQAPSQWGRTFLWFALYRRGSHVFFKTMAVYMGLKLNKWLFKKWSDTLIISWNSYQFLFNT